jgi:hypothetical protein
MRRRWLRLALALWLALGFLLMAWSFVRADGSPTFPGPVLPVYDNPCLVLVYPPQYGQFDPYYANICPAPPAEPPAPPRPPARHHCPAGHHCPELRHP